MLPPSKLFLRLEQTNQLRTNMEFPGENSLHAQSTGPRSRARDYSATFVLRTLRAITRFIKQSHLPASWSPLRITFRSFIALSLFIEHTRAFD